MAFNLTKHIDIDLTSSDIIKMKGGVVIMEKSLYDINEVCNKLGCTSRTLRFYEQKGIISSTKEPFKSRRQYSNEQIKVIKDVLVLRSLGLSIAKIKELQENNKLLIDAIAERQAELIATITSKSKEYELLCESLLLLQNGESIFEKREKAHHSEGRRLDIVKQFTNDFLNELYDKCYESFSDTLSDYLPLTTFKKVVADALKPIGKLVGTEKILRDENLENVYYSYIKYEKLGLYIKIVFYEEKIHGIWLNYYQYKEKK